VADLFTILHERKIIDKAVFLNWDAKRAYNYQHFHKFTADKLKFFFNKLKKEESLCLKKSESKA